MLTVWGRRNSFNVQKVMWLVGELDLPHRHIDAGGGFGLNGAPEFLAMNPHGRVPLIDDGGTVVWESHSILRYLAARYGQPGFWDPDPGRRSRADRWMDWAQTSLQPAFLTGVFWAFYRTPAAQRDPARIDANVALCARYFTLVDGVLAGQPFLAGERASLADIAAGTSLYRYFELDIRRPRVPHVEAWYERLQRRPAYREHVMIPFGELFGRLDY
ncbi:glutathione S-transferase family protein [Burkholderia alba]|uniref:glutathione S-transferase family protein n=1 Tax=Burkholderia alba TaxID=2683677 RepID=UPI002B0627A0|nr:glutathione S-transferase [Burkholderia alba]